MASGRKRRCDWEHTCSALQSVLLRDGASVSGDATSGGEYVDTHVAPSREFLELLAPDVSNYLTGGISSRRCELCPPLEPPAHSAYAYAGGIPLRTR